jgi:hypothetical protein
VHGLLRIASGLVGVGVCRRLGLEGPLHLPQAGAQPRQQHHHNGPACSQQNPPPLAVLGNAHLIELSPPGALRGRRPQRRHRRRHLAGVARPVIRLRGQAPQAQGHQLPFGPAGVQPGKGVGLVSAHCLAVDLVLVSAGVRRLTRQNLAKHRPQPKHIRPRV